MVYITVDVMIPLHKDLLLDHTYDVIEVGGDVKSAFEWCTETFGSPGNRWFFSNYKFYFKHEKDAMWFELKW